MRNWSIQETERRYFIFEAILYCNTEDGVGGVGHGG
jgi:hypothetical protein